MSSNPPTPPMTTSHHHITIDIDDQTLRKLHK